MSYVITIEKSKIDSCLTQFQSCRLIPFPTFQNSPLRKLWRSVSSCCNAKSRPELRCATNGRPTYPLSLLPHCTRFACYTRLGPPNGSILSDSRMHSGSRKMCFHLLLGIEKLLESFRVLPAIAIVCAAASPRVRKSSIRVVSQWADVSQGGRPLQPLQS